MISPLADDVQHQRVSLLQELAAYNPGDQLEQSAKTQMSEFLRREPACFDRTTVEGHCTASAFIVDATLTRTALVYHKKFGRWVQPGGHTDGDGDLRRVAMREAREETSLKSLVFMQLPIFDLHIFNNAALGPHLEHFHFDVRFLLKANATETPVANDESLDAAWIPLNELDSIATDDSVLRLARKLATNTVAMTYL